MNDIIEPLLRLLTRNPNLALLAAALLTSTSVVCVAWALALHLQRRSSRARVLVWRIALVTLLVVAGWRLMPEAPPSPAIMEWQVTLPAASLEAPPILTETAALILPAKTWWQRGLGWLEHSGVALWLGIGAGLFLWRTVSAYAGLIWLRKHSQPAPAAIDRMLRGMNAPASACCLMAERLHSPMLTGWRRPVVWLPSESVNWDDRRLEAVLRHELAHLQRADVLWHWLSQLIVCLWWWQPLVWLARRGLRVETEHAADDAAVLAGGDAHDYARTLVEIAAGIPNRLRNVAGVTMFGGEPVQQRVRELMKMNKWRGRIGVGALSMISLVAVILTVLAATKVEFKPRKPVYQSVAKLVAGGGMTEQPLTWQEQREDFYGTIIETIESAEMKRRALGRVRALNPDLQDRDVEILVSQSKGSTIFNVQTRCEDGKYAKVFLDALLDEFIAFRQSVREQAQGNVLKPFLQETETQRKVMEEKAAALTAFQKVNNVVTLTNANNKAAARLSELMEQREAQRTVAVEMKLALDSISAALAAKKQEPRLVGDFIPADTESSYLKTKNELFVLDNERKFMLQTRKPDHAEVLALDEKIAKTKFLLQSLGDHITKDLQQRYEDAPRRIAALDEQCAALEQEGLRLGGNLAEYERLKSEAQVAKEAFQKLFERTEKLPPFQITGQTDYMAIQERASTATEVLQSGLLPVWRLWTSETKQAVSSSASQAASKKNELGKVPR
ncbi:MAG: M56 family metallopeptidase [Prosthecobacter sp.]|uniref:M56 family metallopeptidase n=1 Tax=Prosthecobacter sp. TaxID=1965333 RepID=UPI003900D8AC